MADEAKALTTAAERAEAQAAGLAQAAKDADAKAATAADKLAAELAAGTSGRVIGDLSTARDAAQERARSARQDADAARKGAKAAREKADRVALEARTVALNAVLARQSAALEATARTLDSQYADFAVTGGETRTHHAALVAHERRYNVTLARPSAGAAALTADLYSLARRAAEALAVLDAERERAAHPAPAPAPLAPVFLIGGTSPRAQRQREALAASAAATDPRRR